MSTALSDSPDALLNAWALGWTFAYNVAFFLSLARSGFGMYLLIRELSRRLRRSFLDRTLSSDSSCSSSGSRARWRRRRGGLRIPERRKSAVPSPSSPDETDSEVLEPRIRGNEWQLFERVAGFQNSHVHFTEPKWEGAAGLPASRLETQLEEMLLRYGFTTVVDTGSSLAETTALRKRIESGEIRGPRILTAGIPLYPEGGIPYYLKSSLPPQVLASLNTPKTPEEAAAIVARQMQAGADVVKLFRGSWVERGRVLPMPVAIARAAADEAHRRGKLVFAPASNTAGLEAALEAGVDVVAHALDDDRGWNESHVARMKAGGMAMIPTLKLFGGQVYTQFIQQEVLDYASAGGAILFGTDVGYLSDHDPADEYELMEGSGLDARRILASLTTSPAERFGEGARRGRIASGMDADLVVLGADPSLDVQAFTDVVDSIRTGRVLYRKAR